LFWLRGVFRGAMGAQPPWKIGGFDFQVRPISTTPLSIVAIGPSND